MKWIKDKKKVKKGKLSFVYMIFIKTWLNWFDVMQFIGNTFKDKDIGGINLKEIDAAEEWEVIEDNNSLPISSVKGPRSSIK